MALIQTEELDIAAIFPQCFDNQFVYFAEFATISLEGGSYKDRWVAESRQKRAMMEINRSLVYGQQVCVNRAAFLNCKPLYELYLPHFVDEDGSTRPNPRYQIDEIGELLKRRALVPYLVRGATLDGDFTFSVDVEGGRALEHLLEKHESSISFMPLGPNPEQIRANTAKMQLEFETRIERLALVVENETLYPLMLADVLPCANLIENLDAICCLRDKIYELSNLASERAKDRRHRPRSWGSPLGMLSREDIYKAVLVRECKCGKGIESKDCICITDGRFDRISKSELGPQFCVKALVDLVYAANMPDMLHRYVLTPWQLPTRNALQDYGSVELAQKASIDDVARASFEASQRLLATASQAMYLPMLEDLTLTDICKILELPA